MIFPSVDVENYKHVKRQNKREKKDLHRRRKGNKREYFINGIKMTMLETENLFFFFLLFFFKKPPGRRAYKVQITRT